MEPTADLHGTVIRPLIVGDATYPKKTWLLRPVKDNVTLTREQKKLLKARIVFEHAIGKTKGRWRVLDKRLDEDSDRIPDTIIAACVLEICPEMHATTKMANLANMAKMTKHKAMRGPHKSWRYWQIWQIWRK